MSVSRRGKRSAPTQETPTPYTLRWTARAQADLEAIDDYISADKPSAAAEWIEKLMMRAHEASLSPMAGRVVPELGVSDIREVLVRAYRIVYRIRGSEIHVLTVFEGHRLIPLEEVESDSDDS